MQIDAEASEYLCGQQFSNGFKAQVPRSTLVSRNDLLVALATGKDVLHVGCADHVELINAKRETGTYLHDLLARASASLTGLDTNQAALSAMRAIGFQDLYTPETLPDARKFDLVLAPDVIEHVPNVGLFLDELRRFNAPVLITTPNAFRYINRRALRFELVNSDHRYWFSPYTLSKSIVEAGYVIRDSWYTDSISLRHPLHWLLATRYPIARDGLAVLATPVGG